MIEEAKVWKYAYFFTLTYAPENIPLNVVSEFPEGREVVGELRGIAEDDLLLDSYESVLSTACKKDIQSWLKRFRTNWVRRQALVRGVMVRDITSDKKLYNALKPRFTYFITAEYAPDGEYVDRHGKLRRSTMRPHYHGIIFTDLSVAAMNYLFGDWQTRFGFVKWERVRQRNDIANSSSPCANYCAKYCCKGSFSSRLDDIADGVVEKPWRLMSKGLGGSYIAANRSVHLPPRLEARLSDYIDRVLSNCFYFDGPYKYKLPRYYYERLFYTKKKFIREVYRKGVITPQVVCRFVSQSLLSVEMQITLRNRILERDKQEFERIKSCRPDFSDDEALLYLEHCRQRSLVSRGEVALIVSQKGLSVGLISPVYFSAVILLILVSSIATPVFLKILFSKLPKEPVAVED